MLADDDGLINSVCVSVLYDCYVLYFGRLKIVYKHNRDVRIIGIKEKKQTKNVKNKRNITNDGLTLLCRRARNYEQVEHVSIQTFVYGFDIRDDGQRLFIVRENGE